MVVLAGLSHPSSKDDLDELAIRNPIANKGNRGKSAKY
jgi:hypothetical protein